MQKALYLFMLITVATIPFDGLNIQIGATFRLSDIFSILSTILLILLLISEKPLPGSFNFVSRLLIAFFLITLLGNLTFLLDAQNSEAQAYFNHLFRSELLSEFRTVLKPLQAFIANATKFSWLLIPLLAIYKYSQVLKTAWVYVISSSIQAFLGILQFLFYYLTGFNLFPIFRGGLVGENTFLQDAFFTLQGANVLRVNALSGEPKGLAIVLCLALAISFFLLARQSSSSGRTWALILFLIQFVGLLLTFSTLGYILFVVGLATFVTLEYRKISLLPLIALFLVTIPFTALLNDFMNTAGAKEIFYIRFIGRLGLEDFDLVYLSFIQKFPSYLLLGTGFGTFHIASFNQASEIISTWKFGVILPKLGIFTILATSGCLGLFPILLIFNDLLSKLSSVIYFCQSSIHADFFICFRTLLVYIISAGCFLRLTTLGLIWIGIGFATLEIYYREWSNYPLPGSEKFNFTPL